MAESIKSRQITKLLKAWSDGDNDVFNDLMPMIEEELRQIARIHLRRERDNHTLQTTALINEAFLRLVEQRDVVWQNRTHFFSIASKSMRRILIDYARAKGRIKRGGGAQQLSLSEAPTVLLEQIELLLMLETALTKLEKFDERKVRVVEMRYFAGMSVEEIAEVLDVSEITIIRDWKMARSWLRKEIEIDETAQF